jgi:hypothetical protein
MVSLIFCYFEKLADTGAVFFLLEFKKVRRLKPGPLCVAAKVCHHRGVPSRALPGILFALCVSLQYSLDLFAV